MKKIISVLILLAATSLLLFSCQKNVDTTEATTPSTITSKVTEWSPSSSEVTTSTATASEEESQTEATKITNDLAINVDYQFHKAVEPASKYYNYEKLELEENNSKYFFQHMLSENELLGTRVSSDFSTESIGIYKIAEQDYEVLYTFENSSDFVEAANQEYIILNSTTDDGKTRTTSVLTIKDKTLKPLPALDNPDEQSIATKNILLKDHTIYFDETSAKQPDNPVFKDLYSYDLQTDEITLIMENCFYPRLYENDVVAVRVDETFALELININTGKTLLPLPFPFRDYNISNESGHIFSIVSTENSETKNSVQTLLDMTTNEEIFSNLNPIGPLRTSENLVSWSVYSETIPYLYVIDKDILVSFDGFPKEPSNFLVYGDHALFRSSYIDAEGIAYYYVSPK